MMEYAGMNTKNIDSTNAQARRATTAEKARSVQKSTGQADKKLEEARAKTSGKKYKKGSLAEKANMVSQFNDVNNK